MLINLKNILFPGETIAVAVSGGCDSMCLLHSFITQASSCNVRVVVINVEHGIRGESSIKDSLFVKDFCVKNNIELLSYTVDSLEKAKEEKLSVEQAARLLRYQCFADAISKGKCDRVATAHHKDDNTETVLFNIFRGTGLKGLTGITKERNDKIIRPFLSVERADIESYAKRYSIPFVNDETNEQDVYTRNYLRHKVVPEIKALFPELNSSIARLTEIASIDDEYLSSEAEDAVIEDGETLTINLPIHPAILTRATIIALKKLGMNKDWEKTHLDDVVELSRAENGKQIHLPKNIIVSKEYQSLTFYKGADRKSLALPFRLGETQFNGEVIKIETVKGKIDLTSGLFADLDKIPQTAVVRYRLDGDVFEKFGGGTKSLGDYFTDVKIPLRLRDNTPLLANGNEVLAIFGIAISNKLKVDLKTNNVIKLDKHKI